MSMPLCDTILCEQAKPVAFFSPAHYEKGARECDHMVVFCKTLISVLPEDAHYPSGKRQVIILVSYGTEVS